MRKWIIATGVLLLFVLVLAGLALVNLNSLINRNKDYLIAQVEQALGRSVAVEDIGVTFWGGIGVRLKRFSIQDDPAFSKEDFVQAADLQINVKLLPLFRKELQVTRAILHQPVINLIKDAHGRFNFSTIGREEAKKKKAQRDQQEKERPKPQAASSDLAVTLVDVDDGALRYVDLSQAIDLQATQVDFKVRDLSVNRPVTFEASGTLFGSGRKNFEVKGRAGPLGRRNDWSSLPVEGELELERVPFTELEKAFPALKRHLRNGVSLAGSLGMSGRFSGTLGKGRRPDIHGTLDLSGVSARLPQLAQAITDVNAKIHFTGQTAELPDTAFRIGRSQVRLAAKVPSFAPLRVSYRLSASELGLNDLRPTSAGRKKPEILKDVKMEGHLSMKNGALTYGGNLISTSGTIADGDYTNLQAAFTFADRIATVESLSLAAFGGSIKARGRYDLRESVPRFAATTSVRAMELTQVFNSLIPSAPRNIRGRVDMDLDVTGAGKEWDEIQKSLRGNTRTEVVDGALLGVNLAESVVSATGIPGLVNLVPAEIRKKYPSIFSSKDTEFKQLKGSATISDGRAHTEDLVVSAAEFDTQAQGWIAFDQRVDLRGVVLFSEPLSQDIMVRAKETKYLANDQGRISIPFTMAGKLPGAKPRPDIGYIARAMQQGAVERGMESLFRRKSRREESPAPRFDDKAPSGSKEKKRQDLKDDILRGLEQLLGR